MCWPQVLRQLVIEMRAATGSVPPHLNSFVMERCAGAVCLAGLQNSHLDVRWAWVQPDACEHCQSRGGAGHG